MILITPSSVVLSVGLYPWMFFNVYIQRYKNAPSKTSNKYILWPRKALVPQYIFIIYFRSIFILSTYSILFLMYIRQDPPTINKLSSIYIIGKNSNFVTRLFLTILRTLSKTQIPCEDTIIIIFLIPLDSIPPPIIT